VGQHWPAGNLASIRAAGRLACLKTVGRARLHRWRALPSL